jgi:hypothetical protein
MNIRIWTAALTLYLMLGSSQVFAWQGYQAPSLAEDVTGTNGLLTSAPGYTIAYADDDTRPMAKVIRTEAYRLFLPHVYMDIRSQAEIQEEIGVGLERCRKLLGATRKPIDIYVCTSISPKRDPCDSGVQTAGIAFSGSDRHVMILSLSHLKRSLVAHEGLHLRLRDLSLRPPSWFEEGMAEFVESEDGFDQWHYDNLATKGPLSIDEMNELKPCSQKDLQARSTAWAMVYFMVKLRGERFAALPMTVSYPNPTAAHSNVKTYIAEAKSLDAEKLAAKGSVK